MSTNSVLSKLGKGLGVEIVGSYGRHSLGPPAAQSAGNKKIAACTGRITLSSISLALSRHSLMCVNLESWYSVSSGSGMRAHKSRHTQRVVDRDGLTTTDEKLSKVRGPS